MFQRPVVGNARIKRIETIDFTRIMGDGCAVGNNSWFYQNEGDYWENYAVLDKNNDGIGDEPYEIPGEDNVDEYPLMMPYIGKLRTKEFYVDEGQLYTMLIIGLIAAIIFCIPVGYIWYRKRHKKK